MAPKKRPAGFNVGDIVTRLDDLERAFLDLDGRPETTGRVITRLHELDRGITEKANDFLRLVDKRQSNLDKKLSEVDGALAKVRGALDSLDASVERAVLRLERKANDERQKTAQMLDELKTAIEAVEARRTALQSKHCIHNDSLTKCQNREARAQATVNQ